MFTWPDGYVVVGPMTRLRCLEPLAGRSFTEIGSGALLLPSPNTSARRDHQFRHLDRGNNAAVGTGLLTVSGSGTISNTAASATASAMPST